MNFAFTKSDFFRQTVHPILSKFPFYTYWLLKNKSYLKNTGWFRSFESGKSVDAEGNPIPWFTYGAIELLQERLPKDAVIFEYGCGLGTKWWAKHSLHVDAVEHDQKWYEMISKSMPENVCLNLKELNKGYETASAEFGKKYDVIIIDGKNRMDCVKTAIDHLTNRGVIVYDDTDREKNIGATQFLKDNGFSHLSFRGFSPIEFMKCETSIYYKKGNLLDI